jgi:hypothetical protein
MDLLNNGHSVSAGWECEQKELVSQLAAEKDDVFY